MEEKTLLLIAVICCLLGIPSLWLLALLNDLESEPVLFLENEDFVEIKGRIVGLVQKEKVTIVQVQHTDVVPVFIFDNVSFKKDQNILIKGKIQEEKGKKEILASEIKTI
ncbi:hypothetical protein J4457_05320 [Candidatus Woesearchaeota archaeon]|nr:hypothetical protein [Candidatus Woesearchaeota archaeon]